MMTQALRRRRILRIGCAAACLASFGVLAPDRARAREDLHRWRGSALGADAFVAIHHPDRIEAARLMRVMMAEIERFEAIFSLYRSGSALATLNRTGALEAPPRELVDLLIQAQRFHAATDGAFDPTVQPLWHLYAEHYWESAHKRPPPPARIAQRVRLTGLAEVEVSRRAVVFRRPGMALTLNGIAQGYITDRITTFLRSAGLRQVVVDLGETRVVGTHPEGRPWHVGLEDPRHPGRTLRILTLEDEAVATSAGSGTRFDRDGEAHHLIDPRNGHVGHRYLSVSVRAPEAVVADALSTGFTFLPPERISAVVRNMPGTSATLLETSGATTTLGAA